jgi:antitoxin component YwqK of YwqJK toxin-antitoxin module
MKVNYDDLDIEIQGNGSEIYLFRGEPYTGLAVEKDEQGNLISETEFKVGLENGPTRIWSSKGQLLDQTHYRFNRKHGESKEWYENGQLKKEAFYELDVLISSKAYDQSGNLVEVYDVKKDSPKTWINLQEWKQIRSKYKLDSAETRHNDEE